MTLEHLRDSLPDYAKDMKLNLSNVLAQTELNEQQLWGTALATAMAHATRSARTGSVLESPRRAQASSRSQSRRKAKVRRPMLTVASKNKA